MRRSLRVLDRVQVKSPCTEDWNEMVGNDEVRFCSHCSKHVHNLSAMTRREAEALVLKSNGNLCIRYLRRPEDQQIVTLPDWMDRPALRRIALPIAAGVMAVALNTPPSMAQNSPSAKPAIQVSDPARGKSSFQAAGLKSELSLEGVVKDTTGAVLAGASVKCTNPLTGESLTTTTNEHGVFRIGILLEGDFVLDVEAAGSMADQLPRIRVVKGENQKVEVVLQPSGPGEIIGNGTGEVLITHSDGSITPTSDQELSLEHCSNSKPSQSNSSQDKNSPKVNSQSVQGVKPASPITKLSCQGIYGTVYDGTKSVVSKAELRLTNVATGQELYLTSDEQGQFQFEKIPPGIYRLNSQAAGFKTTEIKKIKLKANEAKEINPVLHPGAVGVAILVTDDLLVHDQTLGELKADIVVDRPWVESPLLQHVENGKESAVLTLLKQGVKPDVQNEFGETALMLVGNSKTIAKYLVRYGADVNARNQVGTTPLMYAMLQDKLFIPKLLIAGGADVNATDQWGRTALMVAAFEGKTKFIKLLIAAGAEAEVRDQFGKKALNYAIDAEQKEAAKILREEMYKKWLSGYVSILIPVEER